MVQARINCCKNLKDASLSKLIKRNLHLFDQYKERLNERKRGIIHTLKNI